MRFAPTWDNEAQTILRLTFRDDWMLDDFTTSFAAAINEIRRERRRVIIVLDFTESDVPVPRLLSAARYAAASNLPSVDLIIFVGTGLLTLPLRLLDRHFPQSAQAISFVSTLEESHEAAEWTLAQAT